MRTLFKNPPKSIPNKIVAAKEKRLENKVREKMDTFPTLKGCDFK